MTTYLVRMVGANSGTRRVEAADAAEALRIAGPGASAAWPAAQTAAQRNAAADIAARVEEQLASPWFSRADKAAILADIIDRLVARQAQEEA